MAGSPGLLKTSAVVGMNIGSALHGFPDMRGQHSHCLDTFLGECVHLRLQLWDEVHLGWIERNRRQSEPDILLENEREVSEQQSALKRRSGNRVPNQSPKRLSFRRDHGDDFSRRRSANLG